MLNFYMEIFYLLWFPLSCYACTWWVFWLQSCSWVLILISWSLRWCHEFLLINILIIESFLPIFFIISINHRKIRRFIIRQQKFIFNFDAWHLPLNRFFIFCGRINWEVKFLILFVFLLLSLLFVYEFILEIYGNSTSSYHF